MNSISRMCVSNKPNNLSNRLQQNVHSAAFAGCDLIAQQHVKKQNKKTMKCIALIDIDHPYAKFLKMGVIR